jgi:YidC/Oxa1 family membrane protein insertase
LTRITELINLLVHFLRDVTGSDGLAIIAFTVLLRLALYPITLKQTKAMEEMKLLQPKVQELQEKYGSQSEEYRCFEVVFGKKASRQLPARSYLP